MLDLKTKGIYILVSKGDKNSRAMWTPEMLRQNATSYILINIERETIIFDFEMPKVTDA